MASSSSSSSAASTSHVDVLILGAGPTGLGAARRLAAQSNGPSWLMLDGYNRPGGMAVTECDDQGFMWDMGGHVIHSHYDAFNDAIACHDDWVQPSRGGWARVQEQWCPTPIQRHLGNLREGPAICDELREMQKSTAASEAPANLEQFYKRTFGSKLDSLFFAPFNFKQWAWPLSDLEHSWTSLRAGSKMPNVPPPAAVLASSDRPADTSSFPYPRLGTGSLWQSVAKHLPGNRQRYNATVVSIDLERHSVTLQSGETITYGHCVSSLPLNRTIELCNVCGPSAVMPASLAPTLKHSSTTVVGLGFDGPLPAALEGRSWVFGADSDISFHRATILTNFSAALSDGSRPAGSRWSIMFETSSSEHRETDISKEYLTEAHLRELRKWGAITAEQQPASVWYRHLVLGYPVPFLERDDVLQGADDTAAGILQRFEKYGFLSRGRFGGWRYEASNQDYAFVQGIEAVDLIQTGKQETVYWPTRKDTVQLPKAYVPDDYVKPSHDVTSAPSFAQLNGVAAPMIRAS